MSNLNLSGFSNPHYGNQYYKSIAAHGTRSAFEPGSIDATKLAKANSFEESLSVTIDLSKHYDKTDKLKYNPIKGAGDQNDYIKLSSVPVIDPHSLITAVTFDGNNSIDDSQFAVELGVLYGCPPGSSIPSAGENVEYVAVNIGGPDPFLAGGKQVAGQEVVDPSNMNVGLVAISTDAGVKPGEYTQGNLGTPVLRIATAQTSPLWAGKLNVKLKWMSP